MTECTIQKLGNMQFANEGIRTELVLHAMGTSKNGGTVKSQLLQDDEEEEDVN